MPKTAITGLLLSFDLDRARSTPIYKQFLNQLRNTIETGLIEAGAKLPSTRVFSNELGVSRNTVVQAFDALTAEGLLASRVGAGTFVSYSSASVAAQTETRIKEPTNLSSKGYSFRSLSNRGRALVASVSDDFAEYPRTFMPDVPDLREFPIKSWLRLLAENSGRLTGEISAKTTSGGYEPLRRAVAQHLGASRGIRCDWSQVIVTTGTQQSLDLTCRLLLDAGDAVWLEEPGYIGARSVIKANSGVVCPVPVDDEGFGLESTVSSHPMPRFIFVSPARQYPLGMTLSRARREALLKFARSSGAWIVEDDYDNEFRYQGQIPPALYGQDRDSRTIHIGTFSKILLPSLRLGYIVVPPDLSVAFANARAVVDRHASLIEQMVLAEFMNKGLLASHIRRMRSLYRTRQLRLVAGLNELLGGTVKFVGEETGLHVSLRLHETADDVELAVEAARRGVVVRPLSLYYATRKRQQGLLLGFAAFNERETIAGLAALSGMRAALKNAYAPKRGE
jgi:GntR family transcriptional regulator / MocR family aminotransferase